MEWKRNGNNKTFQLLQHLFYAALFYCALDKPRLTNTYIYVLTYMHSLEFFLKQTNFRKLLLILL